MFFRAWVAEHVRHDAERRQGDDIDLGMTEEPEQVLEQNRAAATVYSAVVPMVSISGMKKLVPRQLSSSIMTAPTSKAGKASRPRMVATKMPQIDSGIRISVMPRQRACRTVVT